MTRTSDRITEDLVPSASFAPLSRSGVMLGLSGPQLALVAIAIARPMWQLTVGTDLPGALWSVAWWTTPIAVVAVGSWGGRSFLERLTTVGLFALRRVFRQTSAVVKVNAAHVEGRIAVPGAAGERLHSFALVGVEYGQGAAFVWDAVAQTATAALRFTTDAWDLADDQVKAARAAAVGDLCQKLTAADGVQRVAVYARSYPGAATRLPTPRIPDSTAAGALLADEHAELLATPAVGQILHRDVVVTITLAAGAVSRDIDAAGGGISGLSHVLADRVQQVAAGLPACGVRVDDATWMNEAQMCGAIRLAYDPDAAPWLAEQDWQLPPDALLAQVVTERLDHLVTDSAVHRCWWVERMPALPARAGFLAPLISGGRTAHTVTQVWEAVDVHRAEKRLNNAEASRATAEKVNEFLGRPTTTAHTAEGKELAKRRAELELGYGDVRYSAWITVHAPSLDELERSDLWVASSTPGMKVKLLRGDQWAAFNTAVLPLGIGARA
jgi:hypothetical protein